MTKSLPVLIGALLLLGGCASQTPHPTASAPASSGTAASPSTDTSKVSADDDLNAVVWAQTAAEHNLVYLETYRTAQSKLLGALHNKNWDALPSNDRVTPFKGLKPAVILDIDETVLDNSPYQVRLIRNNGEYRKDTWEKWCLEEQAAALPGAVAFTQFAAKHGIAVIYISNRSKQLDDATIANLKKVGFPVSGPDAVLGQGTVVPGCQSKDSSDKGCRRQWVGHHYRVLMQFGDQLGDFVSIPSNTEAERAQPIDSYMSYMDWIGTRWFVLPNPTYGNWESAIFHDNWKLPRDTRRQMKRNALDDKTQNIK